MTLGEKKQINEDKFHEMISQIAEHTDGGDLTVIGELFPLIFSDLSVTKQAYYIKYVERMLKLKEGGK